MTGYHLNQPVGSSPAISIPALRVNMTRPLLGFLVSPFIATFLPTGKRLRRIIFFLAGVFSGVPHNLSSLKKRTRAIDASTNDATRRLRRTRGLLTMICHPGSVMDGKLGSLDQGPARSGCDRQAGYHPAWARQSGQSAWPMEDSGRIIWLGRQVRIGVLVASQQDTPELADSFVTYSDSVKP